MAEIRSTLDMVLERAEKLAASAPDTGQDETFYQDGMRAGAAFLQGNGIHPVAALEEIPSKGQLPFKKGLLSTFMRPLILPRNAEQMSEGALSGLLEMGKSLPDHSNLAGLISEVRSILSRYIEHRQQLKKQLEESFAQQMPMLEQQMARQTGVAMKMTPSQHPKFAEEWQKHLGSLNEQYDNALVQYKDAITQQLTA